MKLSLEYNVFEDGTAAVEVDGTRIVYIRPIGGTDATVEIVVLNYNEFGLTPIRQPRFRSHVGAAKRRVFIKRRSKRELQAIESAGGVA